MSLSCNEAVAGIALLLDEENRDSAVASREMETHLNGCSACRKLAESLRENRARCRSFRTPDQPRPMMAANRAKLLAAYRRDRERHC